MTSRGLTLIPIALGAAALLLAAPLGWPVALVLAGGVGIGFGTGAAVAGRRAGAADSPVFAPPTAAAVPARRAGVTPEQLTDLELRAKVRGDFEVARLVDRLQAMHGRLAAIERDPASTAADPLGPQLVYKLRQMYDTSAASLERALALNVAAREMATDEGRHKVLAQRSALAEEASSAVGQVEAGIDRLRAAAATAGDAMRHERMTDLNADLDRQLEVARRVEERMNALESRARGDLSAAEAYVRQG